MWKKRTIQTWCREWPLDILQVIWFWVERLTSIRHGFELLWVPSSCIYNWCDWHRSLKAEVNMTWFMTQRSIMLVFTMRHTARKCRILSVSSHIRKHSQTFHYLALAVTSICSFCQRNYLLCVKCDVKLYSEYSFIEQTLNSLTNE